MGNSQKHGVSKYKERTGQDLTCALAAARKVKAAPQRAEKAEKELKAATGRINAVTEKFDASGEHKSDFFHSCHDPEPMVLMKSLLSKSAITESSRDDAPQQLGQTDDGGPTAKVSSRLTLVQGEYPTNVVEPVSYALARRRGGGGEFDGALHLTNFRLVLQRTGSGKATCGCDDESLTWVSFPLSCIKTVVHADEDPLALMLTAKDLRSCRMRFPSNNEVFVATLTQIILHLAGFAQASPDKSFAFAHAHAAARTRAAQSEQAMTGGSGRVTEAAGTASPNSGVPTTTKARNSIDEHPPTRSDSGTPGKIPKLIRETDLRRLDNDPADGWLIYDLEKEFVRQGLIYSKSLDSPVHLKHDSEAAKSRRDKAEKPRWRLFHNRSHEVVPTYPLHVVVPMAMSDADIRSVVAYRSKGRLPAVTWMDPKTKAVLARSAQPLAGLGGKSCAEDERLLRLFHEQGQNPQIPRAMTPPPSSSPDSPPRRRRSSPDTRESRRGSAARSQVTFGLSPIRRPPAIASPDLCGRRASSPPKQAFDDVARRRKEARVQQHRDAAMAAMAAKMAVSTNGSWSRRMPGVEAQTENGLPRVTVAANDNRERYDPKSLGAVSRNVATSSQARRNVTERHSVQTKPLQAATADADVAEREGRSKSDPGGNVVKLGQRQQEEKGQEQQQRSQTQPALSPPLSEDGSMSGFLGMVKMSNWSPPWSLTPVSVQLEQQQPKSTQRKTLISTSPSQYRAAVASSGRNETADPSPAHSANQSATNSPQERSGWKMGGVSGKQGRAKVSTAEGDGGRGDGERNGKDHPRLCVLDARTAVAAMGNQLVGKGVEMGLGNGTSTQVVFSGIGNIHAVNDAFEELRNALDPLRLSEKKDESFMVDMMSRGLGLTKTLDLTQALGDELAEGGVYTLWPKLIRQIMASSVLAARLLRLTGCSVLVHCSDGWDRTPQICATSQLLLDPFYRTLKGFCVLIEKEWLSFGHRFWARCMGGTHDSNHDVNAAGANPYGPSVTSPLGNSGSRNTKGNVKQYDEFSPVFLQFLDVVHNVMAQFPAAFEFTEDLLAFVAEHTFSGMFGTFLCDTERRRKHLKLKQRTVSVWTVVLSNQEHFVNTAYNPTEDPLWPSLASCKIRLWERQHCRQPALRPHHALSTRTPWEDVVSTTARLLGRTGQSETC